jgi:hypothetical protein
MLLANLVCVGKYCSRVFPQSDECGYVLQPITLTWLWQQHAEHRIPLAKFIWLGVLRLTNYDFRAGNFLDVLATGAVAAAMILAARRVRGGTSFADAFFPLALLNFGQAWNFQWWWQVNHVLPPLVASMLLLLIVSRGARLTFRYAVLAGVYLVLLALCGPAGQPYVLAFALWLGYWAVLYRPSPEPRGKWGRVFALSLAAVAVLLVGLYFVGYNKEDGFGHAALTVPGLLTSLRGSLALLSVSLGPVTRPDWLMWGLGVLALWLVSIAVLVAAYRKRPAERLRVLGLLLFMGATGALALAMGWARGEMGTDYIMEGHYLTKTLPALCCVYFIWELYKPKVAPLIQMCLFTVMCLLFLQNLDSALACLRYSHDLKQEFERDLRSGVPLSLLAQRHWGVLCVGSPEEAAEYLRLWHQAGVGEFASMQPDPAVVEGPGPTSQDRPAVDDEDAAYRELRRRVRAAAEKAVPEGATVLVVSDGDDDLLKFDGRQGQHFPQDKGGAHDGNPADSQDAVARLEALRAKGAQYLLLPEPSFWWLDYYKGFKQHLDDRYARVHADDCCVIYRLSDPGERKP